MLKDIYEGLCVGFEHSVVSDYLKSCLGASQDVDLCPPSRLSDKFKKT